MIHFADNDLASLYISCWVSWRALAQFELRLMVEGRTRGRGDTPKRLLINSFLDKNLSMTITTSGINYKKYAMQKQKEKV